MLIYVTPIDHLLSLIDEQQENIDKICPVNIKSKEKSSSTIGYELTI